MKGKERWKSGLGGPKYAARTGEQRTDEDDVVGHQHSHSLARACTHTHTHT